MISRLQNLLKHEGMRQAPMTVLARMAIWAVCVATRHAPVFKLTPSGALLRVPPDLSYTSVAAFVLRDHIEPELGHLEMLLLPEGVFLDVGANIGMFTLKAAHLVDPRGMVVAVEPGQAASSRLAANLTLNGYRHVHMVRQAVSGHVGSAVLHHVGLGHDPQAFSLLDDGSNLPGETVSLTTLDTLVAEMKLERVDVVKLDIEGAEPEAIAGGRELLTCCRPIVIFEINHGISVAQGTHLRAFNMLRDHGYLMYQLRRGQLTLVSAQPDGPGNLVAIHPSGAQPVSWRH